MGDIAAVSAAAAHQVIHGHLGYLSDTQSAAFDTFQDLVAKRGYSHDNEVTLLRFLRARKWDPQAALKQYTATQEWRKKHKVDHLFAEFPPTEFEDAKKFYPRWTGRRDNMGLPVFVYQLSKLEPFEKELGATRPERRYQRIIVLHEHMTQFVLPLCDAMPHPISPPEGLTVSIDEPPPISSVTSIMDLSGIHLTAMWRLRSLLQEASGLATANYPETLHTIAIVNAPSFFATIWGWIKGWFDEGTRVKIHVLGTPDSNTTDRNKSKGDGVTTKTLLSLMPASSLPKMYGGELDFEFMDTPNLDDDAQAALGVSKFDDLEDGPKQYDTNQKKWMKAVADP